MAMIAGAVLLAAVIISFTMLMSIGLFAQTIEGMNRRERTKPTYVSYISVDATTDMMPISEKLSSSIYIHNVVCYPNGTFNMPALLLELSNLNQTPSIFVNSMTTIEKSHAVELEQAGVPVVHLSSHLVKESPCT